MKLENDAFAGWLTWFRDYSPRRCIQSALMEGFVQSDSSSAAAMERCGWCKREGG